MKTVNEPFKDDIGAGLIHASHIIKSVFFERSQLYLALIKLMLEMEVNSFTIDLSADGEALKPSYSVEFVPDPVVQTLGKVVLVHHVDKDSESDSEDGL